MKRNMICRFRSLTVENFYIYKLRPNGAKAQPTTIRTSQPTCHQVRATEALRFGE